MAVHVITGVMGSGKSYEAVDQKILVALKDSKVRIVTNISGLSIPKIAAYLSLPEEEVASRLIAVDYEAVMAPGFWYDPEEGATDTTIQPGDLVVLDEVWRYFNRGIKIPPEVMRFFRMHRHYVGEETNTSCEIVLLNQSLRGLHADIKDIVEVQFVCRKLKALGRVNTYQVQIKEPGIRTPSAVITRNYNKDIFPLYSSYDSASSAVVETFDSRQSIFSRPAFKFGVPVVLALMAGSIYFAYDLVSSGFGGASDAVEEASSSLPVPSLTLEPLPALEPSIPLSSPSSGEWRLEATYRKGGRLMAVLVSSLGVRQTVPVGDYEYVSNDLLGVALPVLNPALVYPFTGGSSSPSTSSLPF